MLTSTSACPRARADAIEAFRRIADRSPAAAGRWYAGIEKAIAKLATMPERHPVAEDESKRLGVTIRQMLLWPPPRREVDPIG
jgi:plasmid stabilization system protein ParE